MTAHSYDLLVIGGGINGAGIARDAAGRGLKLLLCAKDDLCRQYPKIFSGRGFVRRCSNFSSPSA